MAKPPPVPPASKSPKGTGSAREVSNDSTVKDRPPENLREQGHTGNIEQNTTNQGYQQDR